MNNGYYLICLVVAGILFGKEVLRFRRENRRLVLLRQLSELLSEVRHFYYAHEMVDEAVYEALPYCKKLIEPEAARIYEILDSVDLEEKVEQYNSRADNHFLKTFLALCVTVMQYGDKQINGQSLFLMNTRYLKQEIGLEILKREKINHLFSGLMFLVLLPVCFLKAIEVWGISNLPELSAYYHGSFGLIGMTAVFAVTLITYYLIDELREKEGTQLVVHPILHWLEQLPVVSWLLNRHMEHNYGRYLLKREALRQAGETMTPNQFLVKQILGGMLCFTILILLITSVTTLNQRLLLTDTSGLNQLTSSASDQQILAMKNEVITLTNRYRKCASEKELAAAITKELKEKKLFRNEELTSLMTQEIQRRVEAYQKEVFTIQDLILAIAAGLAGYGFPWLELWYRRYIRQMGMEEEVVKFHSIILMLMYMERMTIDVMLEWMERFSMLFRSSIEECLNHLSAGEEEALKRLKDQEPYPSFARLVENLLICDKIGIVKAFDELAVDRVNYQERRKQENDIYISGKAMWGRLFAYLPLIITIGLYLICPFVVESLSQLLSFSTQMDLL